MMSFEPSSVPLAIPLFRRPLVLGVFALAGLSACAQGPDASGVDDPLVGVNRASHAFNQGADRVILRPVSQVYGTVVPEPVRLGVDNVSSNLSQPGLVVNDVLQWRIEDASHNLFRFLVNTTFGIGGLFDPATSMGLDMRPTDFGETLHVWGVGEGAYIELPILGPSTSRDAVGRAVDFVLDPVGALDLTVPQRQSVTSVRILEVVDSRYVNTNIVDSLLYDSFDSYTQLRSVYLQNRRFSLSGGALEDVNMPLDLDPFDDPFAVPVSP